jgi:hypothetical protein
MTSYARIALGLAAFAAFVPTARGLDPTGGRPKVEFRWVESKHVPGLTDPTGERLTCGDNWVYLRLKPVLTSKDVARACVIEHDMRANGLSVMYEVAFFLTDDAKKKLTAACGESPRGLLAVVVDGHSWGMWNFEKAQAEKFVPRGGLTTSKTEAKRIAATCGRPGKR